MRVFPPAVRRLRFAAAFASFAAAGSFVFFLFDVADSLGTGVVAAFFFTLALVALVLFDGAVFLADRLPFGEGSFGFAFCAPDFAAVFVAHLAGRGLAESVFNAAKRL